MSAEGDDEDIFAEEKEEIPEAKPAGSSIKRKSKADTKEGTDVPLKKKKLSISDFIDQEAEESGDEAESDEEGEDGNVETNDYVRDGFVVDDDEDDNEGDENALKVRPKKDFQRLKKKKEIVLDYEDLELIEESAQRSRGGKDSYEDKDEIVPERIRANDQKGLEKGLFDDDDNDDEGGQSAPTRKIKDYEDDNYDSDDLDDFLVDDLNERDGGEDNEEELQSSRPKSKKRHSADGPSRAQLDEAFDIFGDGFEDYLEDGGDLYDEAQKQTDAEKVASIRAQYERQVLIESFCTDRDDLLRKTDRPERYLEIMEGRSPPNDEEREEEATWMAPQIVRMMKKERKYDESVDLSALAEALKAGIVYVLKFIQVDQLEIPFIWSYRRDYLHEEFQKFEFEANSRRCLWKILELDEKWEVMMTRKNRLLQELEAISFAALGEQKDEDADDYEDVIQKRIKELEETVTDFKVEVDRAVELLAIEQAADEEGEEVTEFDKERARKAEARLQELKQQHQLAESALSAERDLLNKQRGQRKMRARYSRNLANVVLSLFPKERYEPMILQSCEEAELRDLQNYLSLVVKGSQVELNGLKVVGDMRRMRRGADKEAYCRARSYEKLREFASKFTVPAGSVGEALRYGASMKVEPSTPLISPEDLALEYMTSDLSTVDEVLKKTRSILAMELVTEPSIIRAARTAYRNGATMSTRPTPKGLETIHPFHELFGLHYLSMKPVGDMLENGEDLTLFIQLLKAQSEGLITIKIHPPYSRNLESDSPIAFITDLNLVELYQPTPESLMDTDLAQLQAWNDERFNILSEFADKYLYSYLEMELKRDLLRLSREAIIDEMSIQFSKQLALGPFRSFALSSYDIMKKCPHPPCVINVVCILLSDDMDEPLFMAYVDKDGVLKRQELIPKDARGQRKEKIKEFLRSNKPQVVVLNASGGQVSKSMHNMIKKYMINEINGEMRREARERRERREEAMDFGRYVDDEDELTPFEPEVFLVKDDISQIFRKSKRAKKMFPELQTGTAAAVCLARFIQNPLAEYCHMWTSADALGTFGHEILFLDLHPLKGLLVGAKMNTLKALERCLVDAVCEIGVDLNRCVTHDHLAGLLAFVGGLGLRKADSLRQNIRRQLSYVESRRELLEQKLLGKVVFTNAAGFLRVSDDTVQQERGLDPFDDTRIHPECYITNDFAPKICADALEVNPSSEQYQNTVLDIIQNSKEEFEKISRKDPTWADRYFAGEQKIRELPDKLSELELEEYAKDLELMGKGKRTIQFMRIKDELRFPWLDRRQPLAEPTINELFTIVTGETSYTLYVGMKVSCKVVEIREKSANVLVDGGLRGFIRISNICDERIETIEEILSTGDIKQGTVLAVKKEDFRVEVSFKSIHMTREEDEWYASWNTDPLVQEWWAESGRGHPSKYFGYEEALEAFRQTRQKLKRNLLVNNTLNESSEGGGAVVMGGKGANQQRVRLSFHPSFKNVQSYKAAEDELRGKGAGEVVFRPSSKGGLSITWAFQDGWFKHIDVREEGKLPGEQKIGDKLFIKDEPEPFSSLDEIIARYIDPMNDYVNTMVNYRSFKHGSPEFIAAQMKLESQENPTRIPYFFRFDPQQPGYFVLTWYVHQSQNPVKSEYIRVTPSGYQIRKQTFTTPGELVQWFKREAQNPSKSAASRPSGSSLNRDRDAGNIGPSSSYSGAAAVPQQSSSSDRHRPSAQHDSRNQSRQDRPSQFTGSSQQPPPHRQHSSSNSRPESLDPNRGSGASFNYSDSQPPPRSRMKNSFSSHPAPTAPTVTTSSDASGSWGSGW